MCTWPNSVQHEKKKERKAKASSSSSFISGFSPSVPVPLCSLPFPLRSSVVATTLSSAACVITYSVARLCSSA